jgi:RNA recognition motif-containing protein
MNLYVGNLSPETTEGDLRTLFSEFGEVVSVKILLDAVTGLPRGFGFVEMADKYHGYDCITNIDMTYYQGNIINVRESKPKGQENNRGGGGFNRSGGNRGGGFNNRGGGNRGGGGYNRDNNGGGYNRERTYNRDNNSGGYNRERKYNSDRPAYNRDNNYNKDNGNSFNSDNPLYKNDDDLNFNKL